MTKRKIYLTTAIDYVNSIPHIGTAYEKIGTDMLARFFRMRGDEVYLRMGNDEHSANVQKAALAQGVAPKQYCDGMRPKFEDVWKKLNIRYDNFIQTSEPRHHAAVNEFFNRVYTRQTPLGNANIYPKDYEGWYCESCEAFYTEKDLVDNVCPNHKTKPKWLKEKNYFFRLSDYAEKLKKHFHDHPDFILPAKRRNEIVNFLEQGLEDISISRSTFDWGIPLPIDPKHVMYVWFDALINYATADQSGQKSVFTERWSEATNIVHVVGKDITRFHAIIWPAMLMAAEMPLPKLILGHGFVYLKGEKMSKSLGNVVTPLDILNKYPEFGADALRYYLLRTSSFGDDGDFTWEGFIERYNADLANGIGNLAARILGMVWKYQNGKIEKGDLVDPVATMSEEVLAQVNARLDFVTAKDVQSHFALEKIWSYITEVDQYIDRMAPWQLAKESKKAELSNVLRTLVESVRQISLLAAPFIPDAARKIWQAYGFAGHFEDLTFAALADDAILEKGLLLKDAKLNLFPRIEALKEDPVVPQVEPAKAEVAKTSEEGLIDIKDFARIDLRVAKVLAAEKVEKADKLLKLQVELGSETRQVIAGIAAFYQPEQLLGKSVVMVANLKPAKIRGIESYGMLLAAKEGDKLLLLTPDGPISSGVKVG